MKSPERYLFRAVLSQAIHDAMYNGLDKYYLIDKRNAIDWLISCLLYTSPSPRDRTRSRMPSSA